MSNHISTLIVASVLLVSCIGANETDAPRSPPPSTPSDAGWKDAVSRLAEGGIFLEEVGADVEALFEADIDSILARRYGSDFEIEAVHEATVDIPDDHFNWLDEPMYVVEVVGRGSECFTFFDASTGRHRLGACGY